MNSTVENDRRNTALGNDRREEIPQSFLDFIGLITHLNEIKRQGWVERGIEDPESVSEHSFQVTVLTLIMASRRGLDVAKAVKMAMIHDWPEVITLDRTPYNHLPPQEKALALQNWTPPSSEALVEKRRQEKEALQKITSKLPPPLRQEIRDLWDEYDRGLTSEAQLVQEMDQAQRLIQAGQYHKLTGSVSLIKPFLEEAATSGSTLRNLARRIIKETGLNSNLTVAS